MDDELKELIAKAKARWDAMSQDERVAEMEAQKQSFIRAEMAFGSDADEAAYRKRLKSGLTMYDTPTGAPPK